MSAYNYIDVRGSYSICGYKRAEAEFVAPRLFNRRAHLSVIGGWREATQVGFYGIGTDTSKDDRTNYLFQAAVRLGALHDLPDAQLPDAARRRRVQPVVAGARRGLVSRRSRRSVHARDASRARREITYLHTQGTVGLDWRTSPGYSRRGGFFGVTLHDYNDRDDDFGFQMAEYEAIAHLPILRETWVLSFRGRVQTAIEKDGQQIPFFMLPALGGGSTLRGYSSWRFRDQNSLLLQAEWRIMVNRYLDLAFFYDAGKVAARTDGSRSRRAEGRLRLRRSLPRAVLDAAPRRAGQEPREQPSLHLLVVRRLSR